MPYTAPLYLAAQQQHFSKIISILSSENYVRNQATIDDLLRGFAESLVSKFEFIRPDNYLVPEEAFQQKEKLLFEMWRCIKLIANKTSPDYLIAASIVFKLSKLSSKREAFEKALNLLIKAKEFCELVVEPDFLMDATTFYELADMEIMSIKMKNIQPGEESKSEEGGEDFNLFLPDPVLNAEIEALQRSPEKWSERLNAAFHLQQSYIVSFILGDERFVLNAANQELIVCAYVEQEFNFLEKNKLDTKERLQSLTSLLDTMTLGPSVAILYSLCLEKIGSINLSKQHVHESLENFQRALSYLDPFKALLQGDIKIENLHSKLENNIMLARAFQELNPKSNQSDSSHHGIEAAAVVLKNDDEFELAQALSLSMCDINNSQNAAAAASVSTPVAFASASAAAAAPEPKAFAAASGSEKKYAHKRKSTTSAHGFYSNFSIKENEDLELAKALSLSLYVASSVAASAGENEGNKSEDDFDIAEPLTLTRT